jgi:hypothetical protein
LRRLAEKLAQGLDRDVGTDGVAKLEAVGDGFRRVGHAHLRSVDEVLFDAVVEMSLRHMHEPEAGGRSDRSPRLGRNSYPDLVWVLGGESVEPQGGEEADDAAGNLARDDGEVVACGQARIRERVEPP